MVVLLLLLTLAAIAPTAAASGERVREVREPEGSGSFREDFRGSRLDARRWTHWWGIAHVVAGAGVLESAPPTSRNQTYSSLVTTKRTWRDLTLDLDVGAVRQLRRGGPPNTWETAWVMFRFRGLHDYYYFILKPNGWELGKKHGSDAQMFLATGSSPALQIGDVAHLSITAAGPRVAVAVDGEKVVDFTDRRPLPSGAIGLYEEDAVARFSAVRVRAGDAFSDG